MTLNITDSSDSSVRAKDLSEYFRLLIRRVASSPIALSWDIRCDARTSYIGVVRGTIYLLCGMRIEFSEYVIVKEHTVVKLKYRYALLKKEKTVVRWDNAPHHPNLRTFPHHKHVEGLVIESEEVWMWDVLLEAEKYVKRLCPRATLR